MSKHEILLKSGKNVFNTQDLSVLWQTADRAKIASSVKSYVNRKRFFRIKSGLFCLDENYSPLEVAQKMVTPSYISLFTALAHHGIIFQYYDQIHSIASYSKKFSIKNKTYIYHQAKDSILLNGVGVEKKDQYWIASPERAICDSLYFISSLGFDNVKMVNRDRIQAIAKIYKCETLEMKIAEMFPTN